MKCYVVLPCFNEEQNIKQLIHEIDETLKAHVQYEVIAVNDGSYDRTGEILKDLSTEYPIKVLVHGKNMGLGAALRTGLVEAANLACDDDFVVTMDSDNTHNPKHVLDMLNSAVDADIVVGSRYVDGGRQLNVPLHRVILSKGINFLVRSLFRLHVRDATSGFRCFRAHLLKVLCRTFRDKIIESEGFVASLELLLKAVRFSCAVKEVPILLDYGKKGGASKMRLFSTVFGYLSLIFRFRFLNNSKRFG
ncbi:MAG: glycosyltransferase family 2 protein [Candidatus Bathyarchaeales archaeon]